MARQYSGMRILERLGMRPAEPAHRSTDPGVKVARSLDVFNASEHVHMVAGIARALGAPVVRASASGKESIVTITIAWELSWYRYEIDLCNEAAGPRLVNRDDHPVPLDASQDDNVIADQRGRLRFIVVGSKPAIPVKLHRRDAYPKQAHRGISAAALGADDS